MALCLRLRPLCASETSPESNDYNPTELSEKLYELSQHITNIDISDVVIAQMQRKYQDKHGMKYLVADIERLDPDVFPRNRFDVIIDKGTLDSLLCGDRADASMAAALAQIHR